MPRSRSGKAARPVRSCAGCRLRAAPDALDRIARAPDGSLRVGRTEPGRGTWVCAGRPDCFDRAARRGGLARGLRRGLTNDDIRALRARLYGAPTPDRPANEEAK
jgi:predicted RNA-binding protein YlxR (DUF448 family)